MVRSGVKYARSLDAQPAGALVQTGVSNLQQITMSNVAGSARFLKLYDKATTPASTDTPIWTIAIPAGRLEHINFSPPLHFALGLGWRVSTLLADSDATAPTAGDVVLNFGYA